MNLQKIGVWMYQNSGSDEIQRKLINKYYDALNYSAPDVVEYKGKS